MSKFELEVEDNYISGYVYDIEKYFVEELTKYLSYENEELEDYVDMIKATSNIFETLIDYEYSDYVILSYNPMGSWYVDEDKLRNTLQETIIDLQEDLKDLSNKNYDYYVVNEIEQVYVDIDNYRDNNFDSFGAINDYFKYINYLEKLINGGIENEK